MKNANKDLRFIVASCEHQSRDNRFTTTVTITVDPAADPMEVSERIRKKAAVQIDILYAFPCDPLGVIVLNSEDTTFTRESGE